MAILVDTNVLSELRKGRRADAHVLEWYQGVDDAELYLSVLVLGEVRCGIERIRRRDRATATALERWLDRLATRYASQILPVDETVADLWGTLDAQHQLPAIDGLLVATALAHDMTLATRNTRDVQRTRVRVVNPFVAA